MKAITKLTLTVKVAVLIILLGVMAAAITAALSYQSAKQSLETEAKNKLVALSHTKAKALEEFIVNIETDLKTQVTNPTVKNALVEFKSAWDALEGNKATYLQNQYIKENPHPTGSKDELDYAADGTSYSDVHAKFHPYLRNVLRDRGYYDIFLFDTSGNLIYTVFKELDYATNLVSGVYAETDLGNAFRAALNGSANTVNFYDFQPYSPSAGAPASFMSLPVQDASGNTLGVLVYQMPIDKLNQVMQQREGLGETGESYVIGQDYLMRSDSLFSEESTILSQKVESSAAQAVISGESGVLLKNDYRGIPSIAAFEPVTIKGVTWGVITQQSQEEIYTPIAKLKRNMMIQMLISMLVLAVIGAFIGRTIAKPIIELRKSMMKVASGERDLEIPYIKRGDEIGQIAGSLQQFRDDLSEAEDVRHQQQKEIEKNTRAQSRVVEGLAGGLKALSDGNLIETLNNEFDPEYEQLRADFNSANTTLKGTMTKILQASNNIQNGAVEMSMASDDLSKRTENQAAALEETAAALDEVTATVQQTAKAAADAHQAVTSARNDAESGGIVVKDTVTAMGSIKDSSEKISQIIGVIDEIAFQTNLLALNAGVEAARAGEAGRGFAVVASEVRALAQRSSDAAKDIKDLISASRHHVETGVSLVDQTGEALDKIVSQVASLDTLVSDIASSATEQATGLAEVNSAINEMDRVTQRNAAMVEESTAACHSLTNESNELISLVRYFKTGTGHETNVAPTHSVAPQQTLANEPMDVKEQQKRASAYFQASQGGAAKAVDFVDENDWQDF